MELIRVHNVAVTFATTFIGAAAAGRAAGLNILQVLGDPSYWLAALVVALVAAGGYTINDYFDASIDAVDKPWRPIPSGRIGLSTARLMGLGLFIAGTLLSLAIGPASFMYAALSSLLLYEYSRRLKRTGVPGNLVVAFNSASSIVYGGLAFAEARGVYTLVLSTLVPAAYAFLLVLGREIVKGVEDYRGDSLGGVKTLAVTLGPWRASLAASVVLLLVVATSPLPFITGLYGPLYTVFAGIMDVLVVWSVVLLLGGNDPILMAAKARRLLKLAFALGAMAFIAGLL